MGVDLGGGAQAAPGGDSIRVPMGAAPREASSLDGALEHARSECDRVEHQIGRLAAALGPVLPHAFLEQPKPMPSGEVARPSLGSLRSDEVAAVAFRLSAAADLIAALAEQVQV